MPTYVSRRAFPSFVAAVLIAGLCLASVVYAQVGPGDDVLLQNDEVVGYIWVPERAEQACEYKEVWYLFENYVYPSADQPVDTTIAVAPEPHFDNEADFRKAMAKEFPGGHFVVTIAVEEREDCR